MTYGVGYPLTLTVAGQLRGLAAHRGRRRCENLVDGDGHGVSQDGGRNGKGGVGMNDGS